MNSPYVPRHNPLTVMADGTIKQVNPLTGTQVWTVPGRGNRPLHTPEITPEPLTEHERHRACAFCDGRMFDTPPEKSRMVLDDSHWRILRALTPEELTQSTAVFRRVPNLYEIVSYDYWRENYEYRMDETQRHHQKRYLASPTGREHVLATARAKAGAGERSDEELLRLGEAFFGGGHDLILGPRHFTADATDTSQLASAGTLTPEEHAAFIRFTIDAMAQLYEHNRYARYVAVFQNWLKPAGASFDHLHKQLVALDERGVQTELEVAQLRENYNIYNEWAVDYASYHNLVIAENQHAVCFAGIGHRYPTIEVFSKSAIAEPWLQDATEVRAMSDLLHACHAATGPEVPSNEEWHHKPVDLDLPMPWRVMIKWRVSTLAGFEGGTKIYVNTLSPENIRDRVTTAMYRLRSQGNIDQDIAIGPECSLVTNSLRYNPLLP